MPTMFMTQEQMDALPKRHAYDLYVTPDEVANALVRDLVRGIGGRDTKEAIHIVDPGAGYGAFGRAVKTIFPKHNTIVHGVEIQEDIVHDYEKVYDMWSNTDFLDSSPLLERSADYVIGNPPYSLAEEFVKEGLYRLKPGGQLLYLMRVEFLHSQGRANGLFKHFRPSIVYICSRRISFQTDGKTAHQEYVVIDWRKGRDEMFPPIMRWWDYQKGIIS